MSSLFTGPEHRIQVLEQKFTVLSNEISQVIGEMQQTMQRLTEMTLLAIRTINARLDVLEKRPVDQNPNIPETSGKEL